MEDSEGVLSERTDIKHFETTDFVCAYCTQGGSCFECKKPLERSSKGPTTATPKGAMVVPANQTSEEAPLNVPPNPVENAVEAPGSAELWFRCAHCHRAAHYAHLKSPWIEDEKQEVDTIEEIAEYYQERYNWRCDDCTTLGERAVDKILAWRPFPRDAPITSAEQIIKKIKDPWPREYLVKWEEKSYRWVILFV